MSEELTTREGVSLSSMVSAIQHSADAIADGSLSKEKCADLYDKWCAAKALMRSLNAEFEHAFIEHLTDNGDIELPGGWRRLYAAPNRVTKSINNANTLEALIEACGGDVDAIAGCLSAQPFRHGACKAMMEDMVEGHGELFETVVTSKTKEGAALKKIQVADDERGK